MATYSQACSQIGSFTYAKYFTLYVVLNDRDGSSSTNKSYVDYTVYCQSSGSGSLSANHDEYFSLNGVEIVNRNVYVQVSSPNAYIAIASGTLEVTHDNDGKKTIPFSASIRATGGYGVAASVSGSFQLNTIPRYANVTESLKSRTVASLTINWGADATVDYLWYSVNGGSSYVAIGAVNASSGSYEIAGLTPNTTYNVKTRVKRKDSQLISDSSNLNVSTYDIARITEAANIEFGDEISISKTNPSGLVNNIVFKVENEIIATRENIENNASISLTDAEWDKAYELLGTNNTLSVKYELQTIYGTQSFSDEKNVDWIFTGKIQGCAVNENGEWKKGRLFINENGEWKSCSFWCKENGEWKRGI